jgi:large subunit ribosomal protein L4
MATEAQLPVEGMVEAMVNANMTATTSSFVPRSKLPPVPATLYKFPTMEPLRYITYPANYLHLPLRKDILHRAVIYEGDGTRQGTASTKWRDDVHGSGRKLYRQKGTGKARVGDKKSPIRRGGGVAFGPHPRDFSTGLPKKIYDLAWRTAFSYRYRRGELIIVDSISLPDGAGPRFFKSAFGVNNWGNANGRSMLVSGYRPLLTDAQREKMVRLQSRRDEALPRLVEHDRREEDLSRMVKAMEDCGADGRFLVQEDLDVKNVLEMGRIIIEKSALDYLMMRHRSDL